MKRCDEEFTPLFHHLDNPRSLAHYPHDRCRSLVSYRSRPSLKRTAMHKLLGFLLTGVLLTGCGLSAQGFPVTKVEGASWLNHLGRSFNDTNMGKTGRLGPSPDMSRGEIPDRKSELSLVLAPQTLPLHGADLYRLNCQGCHGASGLGAPP